MENNEKENKLVNISFSNSGNRDMPVNIVPLKYGHGFHS